MIDWATPVQAARHWADAPTLDATRLLDLLAVASDTCRSYARAGDWRELTDAVTSTGSATLTSVLGSFTDNDLGRLAVGANIPAEARISARASATEVTLSANATGASLRVLILPTRFMLAAVEQAREDYAAAIRETSDVIGVGDFAIRARPLTGHVKQLLRPQRAAFEVG